MIDVAGYRRERSHVMHMVMVRLLRRGATSLELCQVVCVRRRRVQRALSALSGLGMVSWTEHRDHGGRWVRWYPVDAVKAGG